MIVDFQKIIDLLEKCERDEIKLKENDVSVPFNIILSSSDLYYRENFHSDIIKSILEQKNEFLYHFIEFANRLSMTAYQNVKIRVNDYKSYEVLRERHRIDIWIRSNLSKHCIIIENKINFAVDMDRQIPRYIEDAEKDGYTVDAVVYLTLSGLKCVDFNKWFESDVPKYKPLLIEMAASSQNKLSLSKDCLLNCIQSAQCTMQEHSFIRQYVDLLDFLRRNEMNDEPMKKFFDLTKNEENFKAFSNIVKMMDELPSYRARSMLETYKDAHKPFTSISLWDEKNGVIFNGLSAYANKDVKFEVYFLKDEIRVGFKAQKLINNFNDNLIEDLLEKMQLNEDFSANPGCKNFFVKHFSLPKESEIAENFVNVFLTKLSDALEK